MKRLHLGILTVTILLAGGILGYSLIHNGLFPVARVNGEFILLSTIRENASASRRLHSAGLVEDENLIKILRSSDNELLQKTFESLITSVIIKTSASDSIRNQVDDLLEDYLANQDAGELSNSAKTIYGWSLETLKERILKPQIMEEVLVKNKGDDYENWLLEAHTSASVRVWFLPFSWDEGRLVDK